MSTSQPLSGKTAVVTGASSGIGRAIALRFGEAGAHVVLGGRTREAMEETVRAIEKAGGSGRAVVRDVRDVAAVQALVEGAAQDKGRLDILVNNAGVSYPAKIADADPEHWRAMLETNVLALLVGSQAAIRAMRACGAHGHIVNISSIAALRRDSGVYGATKHAVNCISATLRTELEDDPIRVVNVMPGAIATNFARHFDPAFVQGIVKAAGADIEVRPGERLPDEVLDALQPKMKQLLGNPDDVARAVLFAVTQPPEVNILDIEVRPAKQITI